MKRIHLRLVHAGWRLVLLAALAFPVAAFAQSSAEDDADAAAAAAAARLAAGKSGANLAAPDALPGAIDPSRYVLGPGDVLQLALWGRVTRTDLIEVGPEGSVLLPGAGVLHVDGLTLAEGRDRILARVRQQVRGVDMDVRLARGRRFLVFVTGEVKSAGTETALGTSRVADVIDHAVLLPTSSRRRITISGRDGTVRIADLELYQRTGDDALNPYLRDGDIVNVPVASEFVFVAGAVARPGRYELGPRDSLRTLLRIAGDPLPAAAADSALLILWPEQFRSESLYVHLADVYTNRQNPPLHDGERFYVAFIPGYHEQLESTILGEVSRPGAYPIVEGRTRLSDLVRSSGGFLPTADLSSIRLRRRLANSGEKDPELDRLLRLSRNELTLSEYEKLQTLLAGSREDYRVNWNAVVTQGASADLLLRDGDEVRVEKLVSSVRVDGEVRQPAILTYRPGRRVEDYVREAGGYTNRAWRGKVRVTRSVSGQTLLAKNVQSLGPGDFIWVPEKPDVTVWQQAKEVITAVASIATIIIAIDSVRKN